MNTFSTALAHPSRKLGQPQNAEGFLMDTLKTFKQEGWEMLADHTRLDLAECHRVLANHTKYPLWLEMLITGITIFINDSSICSLDLDPTWQICEDMCSHSCQSNAEWRKKGVSPKWHG